MTFTNKEYENMYKGFRKRFRDDEDKVQDAMEGVAIAKARGKPEKFYWQGGVFNQMNKYFDGKAKKYQGVTVEFMDEQFQAPAKDIAAIIDQQDSIAILTDCFMNMKPKVKHAAVQFWVHDRTYEEIAEDLKVSRQAVGLYINAARRVMRKALMYARKT